MLWPKAFPLYTCVCVCARANPFKTDATLFIPLCQTFLSCLDCCPNLCLNTFHINLIWSLIKVQRGLLDECLLKIRNTPSQGCVISHFLFNINFTNFSQTKHKMNISGYLQSHPAFIRFLLSVYYNDGNF